MLLIYAADCTNRLQYICKFIFEDVLGIGFTLTEDQFNFKEYDGAKINYSTTYIENTFQIIPHGLLAEKEIKNKAINCIRKEAFSVYFFSTEGGNYHFDIFAASFYLVTRYEEYLPHAKDMYGRYAHENSLAFKEDFLNLPLVNIWLKEFKKELCNHFTELIFLSPIFKFIPTYDIDIAWSYKEKGWARNIGGFIKKPGIERVKTLLGKQQDPFDSYTYLDELHEKYKLKPLYFFLVARQNGLYDKNILPDNTAMQELIKMHAQKYIIGLHPSWHSFSKIDIINEEKQTLQKIIQKPIEISRQHYIKFTLPETYNQLIKAGFNNDFSMGYGSINGFRASTATTFGWYNLLEEEATNLRIHPFCFMDANCFYEQKLSVTESYEELYDYYKICKEVDADLITIFHNNFLGTSKEFNGWKQLYEKFIFRLQQ